ncbi:MAG: sulfite exporter TauE/SafE family protein [Magnetospirillum sp.]|nr:sulfite exporter TauE/SafE family protein [Magnetospirillum sp.]
MTDISQLLPFAALLLAAGAGAGIIAGLLGVGGGIVVVPVLFHLFTTLGIDEAVRMQVAVGTSLATIVATAWSSTRAHYLRGTVDREFLRGYGPVIVAGVLLGSAVAALVKGPVLTAVFAVVALVVAVQLSFGNPDWRLGDKMPGGWLKLVIGTTIGALSAMMGIGGGSMTVPVMTMYGTPVHRAVGTAAATGFIIGVPGMVGFVIGGWNAPNLPPGSVGFVSLVGLALIAPTSVLCAPLGARLAHRLDTKMLKRVFALFLGFTSLRMFYSILT